MEGEIGYPRAIAESSSCAIAASIGPVRTVTNTIGNEPFFFVVP
jgi:hypothetical protein